MKAKNYFYFFGNKRIRMQTIKKNIAQCAKPADVLFDNFRDDISCEVLSKFLEKGVSPEDLARFAQEVPAVYPWTPIMDPICLDFDKLRPNTIRIMSSDILNQFERSK